MKMKEKIKEILLNDIELARLIISDIWCYNEELADYVWYENNKEFFDTYYYNDPMEAVRAVLYGKYDWYDDFVKIDYDGNLKGCTEFELQQDIENNIEEIIEKIIEYKIELVQYTYIKDHCIELYNLLGGK